MISRLRYFIVWAFLRLMFPGATSGAQNFVIVALRAAQPVVEHDDEGSPVLPQRKHRPALPLKAEYKATEIARVLGMTGRGVRRRAEREGWAMRQGAGLGGQTYYYTFATLPGDVQRALATAGDQ